MNHHKTIIVDFDDTLSFTKDRNWDDASPNVQLISKLNSLHDDGWLIKIFTARGSISCESRVAADKKYRQSIEAWLANNNVKYHLLSFDKPLGAYYIDDKGITPEDFLTLNLTQFKSGLSGADVYTDGNVVNKTADNTKEVVSWFNIAKDNRIQTPDIYRVIGNTISMEYIQHFSSYFLTNYHSAIGKIFDTIDKMRKVSFTDRPSEFSCYSDRIFLHIENVRNYDEDLYNVILDSCFTRLGDIGSRFNPVTYFSHGDFGITNLLFSQNGLYLIDPIPNTYCNSVLDLAKLCASLKIVDGYSNVYIATTIDCFHFIKSHLCESISYDEFVCLIACEAIRVYKYHPNKNFIKGVILDVLGS